MPELPEITVLARQMHENLVGRTVIGCEVRQPKCLNLPEAEFEAALKGAEIRAVAARGKWVQIELRTAEAAVTGSAAGWLLLNLGMGGEILLTDRGNLPEKHQVLLDLHDGAALAITFWWFGYVHYAPALETHAMTAALGPHALDLSLEEFRALLRGRRGGVKAFLLDQKRIAGIGNVYGQDPLFKAGIHPLRSLHTLTDSEIAVLYQAIRETLQESIDLGGSQWEQDLYGRRGRWGDRYLLVAYREGKPCPTCGTAVEKIRTGGTHTHICPKCQRLDL